MKSRVKVAIVGDFDADFPPHRATNEAIAHAAESLGIDAVGIWTPTDSITPYILTKVLGGAHALWIAPGSPYRSMDGALRAIRMARETGMPLLGTCGGFQHVVLEYARSVLGVEDAQHAEYDSYASRMFVVPLSCSLVGRVMRVRLAAGSRAAEMYGRPESDEQYYCNFGLNPEHEAALESAGLLITGRDDDGEARVVELARHPFFIATLFVPSLTSTREAPHPLIMALLRVADARRKGATAPVPRPPSSSPPHLRESRRPRR